MFKKNIGTVDRALRAIVGLALIALALTNSGMAWGWIGIVPLATAVFSTCPAYSLIGLNTCARKA
jgi:hypothetical protein